MTNGMSTPPSTGSMMVAAAASHAGQRFDMVGYLANHLSGFRGAVVAAIGQGSLHGDDVVGVEAGLRRSGGRRKFES